MEFAALPDGSVVTLGAVTSVARESELAPRSYDLSQNYPNPFNPSTQIIFSVPEEGRATLVVFNALGQEVATLIDGSYAPGTYKVDFNATGLPSGSYFYRVQAGDFTATRKMLLMK